MTRAVTPEPADVMETIRHLRAELQSVLEREAATHARHDARVEALEAQIADLEATVQPAPVTVEAWQPIETAPKDGTRFLAYEGGRECKHYECWWNSDFSDWEGWQDDWGGEPEPTHWMPFLPPPRALAGEQPNE
jgi:hypothetical protein